MQPTPETAAGTEPPVSVLFQTALVYVVGHREPQVLLMPSAGPDGVVSMDTYHRFFDPQTHQPTEEHSYTVDDWRDIATMDFMQTQKGPASLAGGPH